MASARILIVDDEPDLRELLELEVTQIGGIDVTVAEDGARAVALISESAKAGQVPFDMILSDINMPKMNGLKLLEEIRARGIDIPFVFLTGYGDREKTLEALRLGAFDFLDKPYKSAQLATTIQTAIQAGQTLRQVNEEIEKLLAKTSLPPEDAKKFRAARKALLILSRQGHASHLKKAG